MFRYAALPMGGATAGSGGGAGAAEATLRAAGAAGGDEVAGADCVDGVFCTGSDDGNGAGAAEA